MGKIGSPLQFFYFPLAKKFQKSNYCLIYSERSITSFERGNERAADRGIFSHIQSVLCVQKRNGPRNRHGVPRTGSRKCRGKVCRGSYHEPRHHHYAAHSQVPAATVWEPQPRAPGTSSAPRGWVLSLGREIQVKLICNLGGNFEEIINKDSNVPLKWKGRKTRGKNVRALKNKTNKSTHCYPVIQNSHLSTAEPHLLSFTVFVQEDHLYLICLLWF